MTPLWVPPSAIGRDRKRNNTPFKIAPKVRRNVVSTVGRSGGALILAGNGQVRFARFKSIWGDLLSEVAVRKNFLEKNSVGMVRSGPLKKFKNKNKNDCQLSAGLVHERHYLWCSGAYSRVQHSVRHTRACSKLLRMHKLATITLLKSDRCQFEFC